VLKRLKSLCKSRPSETFYFGLTDDVAAQLNSSSLDDGEVVGMIKAARCATQRIPGGIVDQLSELNGRLNVDRKDAVVQARKILNKDR